MENDKRYRQLPVDLFQVIAIVNNIFNTYFLIA